MKLTPVVFIVHIRYSSVCTYDCTVDRTALLIFLLNVKSIYLARDILVAILDGHEKLNSE